MYISIKDEKSPPPADTHTPVHHRIDMKVRRQKEKQIFSNFGTDKQTFSYPVFARRCPWCIGRRKWTLRQEFKS